MSIPGKNKNNKISEQRYNDQLIKLLESDNEYLNVPGSPKLYIKSISGVNY